MTTICPECISGKHRNCDGVGNIDNAGDPIKCDCTGGKHPLR